MRKRYKKKRRACGVCKPHKKKMTIRWKSREFIKLKEAEKEMREAKLSA